MRKISRPARKLALYLANVINMLLPPTRGERLAPRLYALGGLIIGEDVIIRGGAVIQAGPVSIGDKSRIGAQSLLIANPGAPIVIGKDVGIAARCVVITGTHRIGPNARRSGEGMVLPISIGDGSLIGFSSKFLAGSGVGNGCVVAAGSVVTKMFGDNLMIGGVPARIIRELPEGQPET